MKNNYSIFLQGFRFLKTVKHLPDFLLDDEVKWYRKCKVILLLFFMAAYLLSPIDLLWDFLFFGLGYVEDIFLILFLYPFSLSFHYFSYLLPVLFPTPQVVVLKQDVLPVAYPIVFLTFS